ncbi:MAG: hypothetical protein GTO45_20145 [Candidatus Aminicenantes bacterium]|nr:hypothetical protein [Candidatus Aminicenantes bacterium]NIM81108.1 hypothetical protein [Candidatus Aminicenantes bacterium]NIN20482.1 hypothetical protein [Candidatus Aminicenantes bacterium]NIN44255.1 hypothetical protein [Candidatus Aminicenantes bacterium]NIN87074.1 hypothetical protein [Candidatus Aminicenantes bacterium]
MCFIRRIDKYLLLRLLALGILIVLYHSLDWTLLRLGLRRVVSLFLGFLGYVTAPVDQGSELYLLVDYNCFFELKTHCIYADVVLFTAPFCWRFQRAFTANMLRLAVLVITVQSLNILRVVFALHLYKGGVSWQLAHNVPDLVIHFTVISTAVLLALRSDRLAACHSKNRTCVERKRGQARMSK